MNTTSILKTLTSTAGILLISLASIGQSLPSCSGFKTFTQGGWGTNPNGNNPGTILHPNFAAAFPQGLTIGCTNTIKLTTAAAVTAFLPQGTTPRALNAGNLLNPTSAQYKNVLAGQLVAATLSSQFDFVFPNFASSNLNLRDLIIGSGTFQGWTVSQLLAEANRAIGGCGSAYSFSQLNAALTAINENYVNGSTNNNYLRCPSINVTPLIGNVNCFGGNNGSISLTVSGGVSPYTYLWSTGSTSQNVSGLAVGSYSVTISDNAGQNKVVTYTVSQPLLALGSTSTQVDVICFGATTGSISQTVTGGTPPYTYLWSNNATTKDISGLTEGSYSVIITDAAGCNKNLEFYISENPALILSASVTPAIGCECNGTANAEVSGGVGPYSYAWSDGSTTSVNKLEGICAGTNVSVTITDSKGCQKTASAGTVTYQTGCTGYEVIDFRQGFRNNGTPVGADRSNPSKVLGAPDFVNAPGGFFSLGFGGWIIIKLDGAILNSIGNDLKISETTFGSPNPQSCTAYPERARIFVSQDLNSWHNVGEVCQDGEIDIAPLSCIMYVKILDITNPNAFGNQIVDGYDVDAIQCIGGTSAARLSESSGNSNQQVIVEQAHLDLFPNPTESGLNVSIGGVSEGQDLQISIVDMLGRTIQNQSITTSSTTHNLEVGCDQMTSGIYFVSVKGTNFNQTKKFLRK